MKKTLKKISALCVVGALAFSMGGCVTPMSSANSEEKDVQVVMDRVYPALVRIFVVVSEFKKGQEVKMQAAGSGSIISPDGYVVTNHHVVGHAKQIWCTLPSRERVEADLIGTDPLTDIAIIKLKPETMRHPVKNFAYAKWGNSDKLKVGQKVFAMGSPGAMAQSVTCGIIANKSMIMPGRGMELDGERVGDLVRWIMHDATIFHGNSGGPLVDIHGRIIGVNELGTAALGGAIPANIARYTAEHIIKYGTVDRSWCGLHVQKLLRSDTAEKGVLVSGVVKKSPADEAGIKVGDRIISINKKTVKVRFAEQMPDYNTMILNAPVGKSMDIVLVRNGKEIKTSFITVKRGFRFAPEEEVSSWGVTFRKLNRFAVISKRLDNDHGVVVSGVRTGGAAGLAKPAIRNGDVIIKVGEQKVNSIAELRTATKKAIANKGEDEATIITFLRGGNQCITAVKFGAEDESFVIPKSRKAWFPARTQVFTRQIAEAMHMDNVKGVRIIRLFPQLKDLNIFKVGDIITSLDDKPVDASELSQGELFDTMVKMYQGNTEVEFTVLRNKKPMKITYTLPREPKPVNEMKVYKCEVLGMKARKITIQDKIGMRLGLKQKGIIITDVKNGGWASLAGVRSGFILLSVNGIETNSAKQWEKLMKKFEQEKPKVVIFKLTNGVLNHFAEVYPEWKTN